MQNHRIRPDGTVTEGPVEGVVRVELLDDATQASIAEARGTVNHLASPKALADGVRPSRPGNFNYRELPRLQPGRLCIALSGEDVAKPPFARAVADSEMPEEIGDHPGVSRSRGTYGASLVHAELGSGPRWDVSGWPG